ncbi:hypothetical protein SO802_033490 [Lithocarpus litseifolius]|uniref:Uncharacterized protein n=1 Tax=Lithocarpus litseifolius TaxID=425828 RepID=A0AAW2BGE1_9ROSI
MFLTCPVAKALWFALCWGFKLEEAQASTPKEIVNLVLDPSTALSQSMDQWKVSLTNASTLEEIWRLKNPKLHSNSSATLTNSIQLFQRYVHNFIEVSSPTSPSLFPHVSPSMVPTSS